MNKPQKIIFSTKFGSNLYGTALEGSDVDVRAVFVPEKRDMLLGRVNHDYVNQTDELDYAATSLHQFIKHIVGGQSLFLDMLFAPETMWTTEADDIWFYLYNNRDKLINRKCTGMLGFFQKQAEANDVRVEKFQKLSQLVELLDSDSLQCDTLAVLGNDFFQRIRDIDENFTIIEKRVGTKVDGTPRMMDHLKIFEKTYPTTTSTTNFKRNLEEFRNKFGKRISQAEGRHDWKAIYHSIRIGEQIVELLETGKITFPRPEASWLIEIRKGNVPYDVLRAYIDKRTEDINRLLETSHIPEDSDHEWIENFIYEFNLNYIRFDSFYVPGMYR